MLDLSLLNQTGHDAVNNWLRMNPEPRQQFLLARDRVVAAIVSEPLIADSDAGIGSVL